MVTPLMKFIMLAALFVPICAGAAAVEELPASMIINGTVSPSSDGKLVPVNGDTVLVVNPSTKATEASGVVNLGSYNLILTGTNGTALALNLKHGGKLYSLLFADGSNAAFTLSGSFLPVRYTMNVVASTLIIEEPGTGGGGDTPPPASLLGDLNGDHAVNQVDVGLLKDAISGRDPIDPKKMDINSDQVVNTRDLIDLIRLVRENSRFALKPASIIPTH